MTLTTFECNCLTPLHFKGLNQKHFGADMRNERRWLQISQIFINEVSKCYLLLLLLWLFPRRTPVVDVPSF